MNDYQRISAHIAATEDNVARWERWGMEGAAAGGRRGLEKLYAKRDAARKAMEDKRKED